jgi:hypothetical protein
MKVNYPTNMENSHTDFSDNFHNIKISYKLTDVSKFRKTALFFRFFALEKSSVIGKFFQVAKINTYKCQIIVLKFQ